MSVTIPPELFAVILAIVISRIAQPKTPTWRLFFSELPYLAAWVAFLSAWWRQ